jgi:hypothetical protein
MKMPIVIGMTDKLALLAKPPKKDNHCGTAAWLGQQDGPAQQAINDALANKDWKSTDLHALLQSEFGYPLGYNQLVRHRNGVCCG